MSLSVFPIAPQAPGLGVGAAAPDGAAAGFDALLAALFGETGQAPPAPAPAKAAGKAVAAAVIAEDEGEASASLEDGEAANSSAEAALLAAAAAPAPAPVVAQSQPIAAEPEPATAAAVSASGPAPQALQKGSDPTALPAEQSAEPQTAKTAVVAESAPEATAPEASDAPPPSPEASHSAPTSDAEVATPPQISPHHASARAAAEAAKATPAPAPAPAPSASAPPQSAVAAVPASEPPSASAEPAAPAAATTAAATQAATAQAMQGGATPVSEPALRSLRGQVSAERAEPTKSAPDKSAKTHTKASADAAAPGAFALVQATPPAAQAADPRLTPAPAHAAIAEATDPQAETADTTAEMPELPPPAETRETAEASASPREASRLSATPETVANLAAQMSRKLQGRTTHFDIQLQPEGLGRVDVRVDIDAQGRLTAAMSFDNPHAANELRGRSAELQRSLEQAGFDLSGGLSFQSPDGGGGGRFAEQQAQRDFGGGRAFQSALGLASEADSLPAAAGAYQQRRAATGVDIRI